MATTGGAPVGSGGALVEGPAKYEVLGVTTWRDGRRAAYSIMHDDTCNVSVDNQFELAEPALTERGLRATFGAIVGDCFSRDGLVDKLESLRASGHEVANHSYSHPNLPDLAAGSPNAAFAEMDDATEALQANLTEMIVDVFLFPYDAFDDGLVAHLESSGLLAARAGSRGSNAPDFDPFRLNFDVYGPGFSVYAGLAGTACAAVEEGDSWDATPGECRAFLLDDYVDDVLAAGGYGIREVHSVEGEAWEPVPLAEYEAHLDYVSEKVRSGDLWVETVGGVVRYRLARQHCALPFGTFEGLGFEDVSTNCVRAATELTYRVRPLERGVEELEATQDGRALDVRRLDGEILVSADPTRGAVTLAPRP